MLQWGGVQIVHDEFAIYIETCSAVSALNLNMIPMVRTQQMDCIGIFLQDGRTVRSTVNTTLVTVIATKTRRAVVIATIAQVVHLQRVTAQEDATTPLLTTPDVFMLWVAGQPETVQIAQTVTVALHHHLCIVLNNGVGRQLLLAPQRQSLGSHQFTGVAAERYMVILRLRFHHPVFVELFLVQS